MAPKRKAKGSARAASTPASVEDPMAIDTPQTEETPKSASEFLRDPWTDEQETSLFKGIIKWKPAGIHRHFRMISLSSYLRNHGYDPEVEHHTRIPGIWSKLRSLYNLDVIDDRENSFEYENGEDFLEFELPDEDYEVEQFMRGKRSSSEAPSSSPEINRSPSPGGTRKRKRAGTTTNKIRASTIEDTDEPKTSPASSPAPKTTRTGRSAKRSMGRTKAESSSRAESKDTGADEEDEEEEEEEDEDDPEAAGDEEEEENEASSSKVVKGKTKSDGPSTRKSRRKR